jgi:hypothetical protein
MKALFFGLLLVSSNTFAANTLRAGDVINCSEVDGPRTYRIEITSVDGSTHDGEAFVISENDGERRQFSGSNARYEEFSDKLGVELRAGGRVVETITFWDSIVYREVDGELAFNNGQGADLRCSLAE